MSKAGFLDLILCYQQVNIFGNSIFLCFYDVFLPCSRGIIRIIIITFLLIVFYSNTAIKLAFLSRSFGRPKDKSKLKSTKVFII
jgi:hypothetical protein